MIDRECVQDLTPTVQVARLARHLRHHCKGSGKKMNMNYAVLNALFVSASVAVLASGAEEGKNQANRSVQPEVRARYRLGPGDEIRIQQPNVAELDGKTARIDDKGFANLPLAGRVELSGLTVEQAETTVALRLSRLVLHPQPVIAITEYRSQPVSVLGRREYAGSHSVARAENARRNAVSRGWAETRRRDYRPGDPQAV